MQRKRKLPELFVESKPFILNKTVLNEIQNNKQPSGHKNSQIRFCGILNEVKQEEIAKSFSHNSAITGMTLSRLSLEEIEKLIPGIKNGNIKLIDNLTFDNLTLNIVNKLMSAISNSDKHNIFCIGMLNMGFQETQAVLHYIKKCQKVCELYFFDMTEEVMDLITKYQPNLCHLKLIVLDTKIDKKFGDKLKDALPGLVVWSDQSRAINRTITNISEDESSAKRAKIT